MGLCRGATTSIRNSSALDAGAPRSLSQVGLKTYGMMLGMSGNCMMPENEPNSIKVQWHFYIDTEEETTMIFMTINVVLSVANLDTRVDDVEFEENELYAIDIVTSTGDSKLLDEKQTTIYKRAVYKNYHLKIKSSRFIFSEISQKFPIMPFSARPIAKTNVFCSNSNCMSYVGHTALEKKHAWLGLVECVNYELLQPYPVLHEKPELQPTKNVYDLEVKAWLALHVKSKKKGGGKKKKSAKKGDEAEPMDETNGGAQA
ncbi:ERBB-3 binding protein 1 [Tanacetum coccineum]